MAAYTHTHPYKGPLSMTTWVGQYRKKHSPTRTHLDHQASFINFFHPSTMFRSILLVQFT